YPLPPPRPLCCLRLPCTTLFRSRSVSSRCAPINSPLPSWSLMCYHLHGEHSRRGVRPRGRIHSIQGLVRRPRSCRRGKGGGRPRSEEHTSELQSRENLVCRLLLE